MKTKSRMKFSLLALLALACSSVVSAQGVVINEFQSTNTSTIVAEDGLYYDWIELYNAGSTAVDLNGYGLSDDVTVPMKWTFPSVTIQPNTYLLVFASGFDRRTGTLHATFSIKAGGETLLLTKPDLTRVDEIPSTVVPTEQSFGRQPDGQSAFYFFVTPTPGLPNTTEGYQSALTAPTFSQNRGFYNTAFNLTMTTTTSGATIRYTTNGSDPVATSTAYTTPISITAGTAGAFKATPVRARCFKTGCTASPATTNTYFVGTNAASKYNLSIVSLATDDKNFFDPEIGIYVSGYYDNYNQTGDAWERPIHIEYFEPGSSTGFSCDGGVRIHGGWTRNIPQKSLRLYADHQGGPGTFNYKIFSDSNLTDYRRLLLRNSGNDNEHATGAFTLMRDGLMQSLVEGVNLDTQNYKPTLMFYNGAYWGIYGLQERIDKEYIRNHNPGIDEDNLDLIQQTPEGYDISEGDSIALDALHNYIRTNDLTIQSNYEYVKTKMDVGEVANNWVAEIFSANTDWPGNNIRYWRPRTATGVWRWVLFDTDFGFGMATGADHNTLAFATCRGAGGWPNPDSQTAIIGSLMRNREFRDGFISKMDDMLNSVYIPTYVNNKITSISSLLSPNITAHLARWGSGQNITTWNNNIQGLRNFAAARPAFMRSQFVKFFHLSGTSKLTMNISNTAGGTVKINTLAAASGWQGTYFNETPVKLTATPTAGYHFVRWQGGITSTQNPATTTLSGDISVTAVFEVN